MDGDRNWWRLSLALYAAVSLAVVLLYWGTAAGMVAIWMKSETFTHAFLVPPLVLWLAWRTRSELRQITPNPVPWMLLPMLVVGLAWILGQIAAVNAVTQTAFVALLVLAVPALLGFEVAGLLLFPLSFAFFAVPLGEFALPVLMKWTADFTVGALRLSGIPVYREGLRFVIPTGSWSVVEACSGVRYLIASLMVGSLFAYLNYRSNKRRAIFLALSIIVPILANWLRAYMIVMLGHLSNNQIATGVDHLIYGWVFFGVVIMALFTIGARWAEPDLPPPPSRGAAADGSAAKLGALALWLTASMVSVVVVAPKLLVDRLWAASPESASVSMRLPDAALGGWQADGAADAPWTPDFQGPTVRLSRAYVSAGSRVGIHLMYYARQGGEGKLVSSTNYILRANDYSWNPMGTSDRWIGGDDAGAKVLVRETDLIAADKTGPAERERLKIWSVYWVDGEWIASDFGAKLGGAKARLRGHGDGGAALMLYASELQPGGADAALSRYWRDNRGLIEDLLDSARGGKP